MAEESERVKQFTYQLNSNLVIQRDRSSRLEVGPSDEVTSLSKISPEELTGLFGANIKRNAPPKLATKKTKKRPKKLYSTSRLRGNVLEAEGIYGYKPKSLQTKRVYDLFLNNVSKIFPGDSHDLIKSCADMALEILKEDSLRMPERKTKLEKLLKIGRNALENDTFAELYALSKKLTDFSSHENSAPNLDDVDVPIEFDDDEEMREVLEDDEDQSDEKGAAAEKDDADLSDQPPVDFGSRKAKNGSLETAARAKGGASEKFAGLGYQSSGAQSGSVTGSFSALKPTEQRKARETGRTESSQMVLSTTLDFDSDAKRNESAHAEDEIDLREIEAYWLQKKVSVFFRDPLEAQEKAQKVLLAMSRERDSRYCENKLVELLGFEAFELIKLLMKNRQEVVYCVKLAQCSEEERAELEREMRSDERLNSILEKLNKKTTSLQDRTKKIREDLRAQAASLKSQSVGGGENEGAAELSAGLGGECEIDAFKKRLNIDLDSIAFKAGGHTNTNKNWTLPEASKKIQKKGYMEIYIPFKRRDPKEPRQSKKISDLPKWAQPSFSSTTGDSSRNLKSLNHVQTTCFRKAFESDDNLLLCAPTGAGKTVVAQLCMLRCIGKYFDAQNNLKLNEFKIVYIAPMKSLVREMVNNFSRRFQSYGISVKELSGDQQLSQEQISNTQIIVTTPEKWDIVTRKGGERTYTQLVRLLIIDEIHLLHDSRGPVLEAIVARSIRQIATSKASMRIAGLSATLPNYENVAFFLRVPDEAVFFFDQGFRPCPLTQCFVGLASSRPYKQMELMNEICYEKVLAQREKQQQVLIFVHSRRETFNTAKFLREKADENDSLSRFLDEGTSKEVIQEELEHIKDERLREVLADGIAIHHAGLSASDRRVVEDLFMDRHVSVLVSTATLAWGVNLPAHCVVIKGTQVYSPEKSRWTELSMLDVMQMTGRAGRPGLDSYGEAFILTTQKELKYYMSLLTEQLPIESQLVSKLPDVLNAEVVLGTVRNVHEAIDWLSYTYLYVRMLASPALYGVPEEDVASDPELRQRRVDLVNSAAILLDKSKLLHYDRKGAQFQITDFGRIAAHYYLSRETMKTFREHTKQTMSEIEILRVFSLSQEFAFVTIREEEKLELAKLLDKVPIPIKENAEEPTAKVNVLLQAYISRLKLDGYQLQADMMYVIQSAGRLMRALFAITSKLGWASAAKRCLALSKCIEWRMWSIESPLRQFSKGIAPVVLRRVERKEFPWERWLDLKPHEIGSFIDHSAQGKRVFRAIHSVPRLKVTGQLQPITRSLLRLELALEADFEYDASRHFSKEPFWIFVEDVDGESFVHYEYFLLNTRHKREQIVSFTIPIFDPLPPQYFIRVISDRFLGSENMMPVSLASLILPQKFAPPTELLDLTAQPTSALNKPENASLFDFGQFNAIQTQTFNTLYKTDENTLICAPPSSGKTVCAELAILRMIEKDANGKCVYMAPKESIASLVYKNWVVRFAKLGESVSVALLTGDLSLDQKLLSSANVIVSDAIKWNALQRRWRRRKAVQNVSLFIMDEMHMLTSRHGHIFEECVSRMRYIVSQTENPVRFVGLAASVANARDLGEWIGCKASAVFNFPPSVRPVRLDLSIQSFAITQFDARMLAMVKPAFQQITQHSGGRPAIVFVPSRKFARQVAVDLVNLAEHENTPARFLSVSEDDMAFELARIGHDLLKRTLRRGVGFLHSRMGSREKQAVFALFKAGAIQVLVAEQAACWSLETRGFLVLVLGTKRFDGTTQNYVNYPVFDLLQMLGKAARPGEDSHARAVVFCESPRREFLEKFLREPFPVESSLDAFVADYMNAEVVNETIENMQEALDFLTWTFLYLRLHQNPNFYNLFGTSQTHISEYLSKLSEDTLEGLKAAGCIQLEEGGEEETSIAALNLGHIASYYNIQFGSIEVFVSMLSADMTLRRVLEVLVSAEEFLDVPVRRHEEAELRRLFRAAPLALRGGDPGDSRTKVHILFQAHFSRQRLPVDMAFDRNESVKLAVRLLFGMVDVIASNGWLKPALAAMELCQMLTQGVWDDSPHSLQLPHVDDAMAGRLKAIGVESPLDLAGEDESKLREALSVSDAEFADIATVANEFPNPELTFSLENAGEGLEVGRAARLRCSLARDEDGEAEPEGAFTVFCPRFPAKKVETWWVLLGDPQSNSLLGIKRVAMARREMKVSLDFVPSAAGKQQYALYLMSDSYLGVDQEYQLEVDVSSSKASKRKPEEATSKDDPKRGKTAED